MKGVFRTMTVITSLHFTGTLASSIGTGPVSLKPRHSYEDLRFSDLDHFMDGQNAVNWTDDGAGGRLAFLNDELYEQGLAEMAANGTPFRPRSIVNELQPLGKRQASSGTNPITEDNGDKDHANWICRSGLGQNIARSAPTSQVCSGLYQALKSGATGRWFWQAANQAPDENNNIRQLAGIVTMWVAENQLVNSCTNLILYIIGENGCPPQKRRSLDFIFGRQDAEPTDPNAPLPELTGGGIVEVYSDDTGEHIASIDLGTYAV